MPTIPTGQMERELRALYLRWLSGVSMDSKNLTEKIATFEAQSKDLIERLGGRTAALGALADFPAPKLLDLSPHVGTIYSDMQQAAIQAGILAGMQSTDVARAMFNAGMDKSFNRLNRLARTETVSAYWKNAWGSIADLPALVMVWGSEDGPRTCAWCRERDGLVMTSSDLRDHPNGRCTPIPTLRSQVQYRGSISPDGSIFNDPDWAKPKVAVRPLDKIPKQASTTDAEYDTRQVWPQAQERDLPFSELLDSEDRMIESALMRYMGGGYVQINDALRRGLLTDARMTERIDILRKVTSEVTTKDLTLNRGMGSLDFLGAEFKKPDFDPSTLVGKSFKDKGFVSTSYAGDIPLVDFDEMSVQMEIMAPKGTHGSLLGNQEEREFLLAPGSNFTILDAVRSADGKLRIRVALTQEAR